MNAFTLFEKLRESNIYEMECEAYKTVWWLHGLFNPYIASCHAIHTHCVRCVPIATDNHRLTRFTMKERQKKGKKNYAHLCHQKIK